MTNVKEEIKAKLDIIEVLSDYLTLKPAGANYRALCPFHHEKTPSFMISPERQIWHCFGCDSGGDIFTFVMKMENVDFPEALRILAKRAGVVLKYEDPQAISQKTKVADALKAAADFYHQILLKNPAGKLALDYLQKRGVSDATIKEFQLGYAPSTWDGLLKYLTAKKFSFNDLELAGLIVKKNEGGYFDRFRERLLFPICDLYDNVVGFTGRILQDKDNVAKYLNSPETTVYNKSRLLFGLNKAKAEIKKAGFAILVEGNMDFLSSYQAGIKNIVASSGTALTLDQIKLLKRYTQNLVLGFDADLAGQEATKRGIELVLQEGMNLKIITALKGKDPDDCIREDVKIWEQAIKTAKPIMEYYFEAVFSKINIKEVENKKRAAAIILPILTKIASKIEQDYWLKELAQRLEIDENAVRGAFKDLEKNKKAQKQAEEYKKEKDKLLIFGQRYVGLILKFSSQDLRLLSQYLLAMPMEIFNENRLKGLVNELIIYYNNNCRLKDGQGFFGDLGLFINSIKSEELKDYLNALLLPIEENGLDIDKAVEEIQDLDREIKKEYFSRELKKIEQELRQAEKSGDKKELASLSQMFHQIMAELSKLSKN